MTYATATFSDVTAFDGRIFAFGEHRRVIFGGVALGLGSVAAIGVVAVAVTLAAVWMVGVALSTNPHLHAKAPIGPAAIALTNDVPTMTGTPNFFASSRIWTGAAYAPTGPRKTKPRIAAISPSPDAAPLLPKHLPETADQPAAPLNIPHRPAKHEIATVPLTHIAKLTPPAAPVPAVPLPPKQAAERANRMPLPPPRPSSAPQIPAKHEIARAPAEKPRLALAVPPPPAPKPAPKLAIPPQAHNSNSLPEPDSRTAIYDIAAHTVYMPDGKRLEAHSGLGRRMDNPRYVKVKARGPTPPNVYKLTLRRHLFHGVRAIRLNPEDDARMFGRDGMLAHTYMLGPSGQSNGCVSFKNYHAFLRAFLKGEVNRMVVVAHLAGKPPHLAQRRHADRFALNNW